MISEKIYKSRREKLLKLIPNEAALIVSPLMAFHNRDIEYPYRQNSDLLYLTGITEPEVALVLIGKNGSKKTPQKAILFLRDRDIKTEKWLGETLGLKRAKSKLKIDEVKNISSLFSELPKLLRNTKTLHHSFGVNTAIDQWLTKHFANSAGPFATFPNQISDVRLLTAEMRFVKDSSEIKSIKQATKITALGIKEFLGNLKQANSERHAAQMLETAFVKQGSDCTGFNTIIASGKNATVLHHSPTAKKISKNELLLIDAGAGFENYSGDISRTIPAGGKFSKEQAEIYDIVLSALYAGIKQAKPKSTMDEIHKVAVVKIVEGLKKLKLLKGSTTQLIKSSAYQKFYMHRTGHFLGLDVHDINPILEKNGKIISAYSRPLVPGNVITIEPGIYIDTNEKSVPKRYRGIGIRIEEDVLITKTGNQVLSKDVPVERDELEKLINLK